MGNVNLFHKYSPSKENYTNRIANRSLSVIEGIVSITILKDLTLNSMLHVPKLDYNLQSTTKLIRDHNCVTKSFPNLCEFQDLDLRNMIGNAEMC